MMNIATVMIIIIFSHKMWIVSVLSCGINTSAQFFVACSMLLVSGVSEANDEKMWGTEKKAGAFSLRSRPPR